MLLILCSFKSIFWFCLSRSTDVTHFANRFPEWDENDIWDLKIQFMAFDLNNDGLIDFPEL